MPQLVYTLRFTGRATPTGLDGGVLDVKATAPGATFAATIGPDGLVTVLVSDAGAEAVFASALTFTGETSFQEVGTIVFGDGNLLRFATVGSGYRSPVLDVWHGAAVWRVEGGTGQFAGASGLITAHLLLDPDLSIVGHHLGVISLR